MKKRVSILSMERRDEFLALGPAEAEAAVDDFIR
jgi:hypothetical protein